ncbi:MAG: hypothetical protein EOP47_27850, partial [Sphingobacteriaceae bacterium]
MQQFSAKLRLIFLPLVVYTVAITGIYTFLHWIIIIKSELFQVEDIYINFGGPVVLAGIIALIWLRPRIKLLDLTTKSATGDWLTFFIIVTVFAMALPNIIAQEYLVTATGKLTLLNGISQIDSLPKTKYYTVKQFYIDKKLARVKPQFDVSGKHNQSFNMTIYVACPMFNRDSPAITHTSGGFFLKGAKQRPIILLNGEVVPANPLPSLDPKMVKSIKVLQPEEAIALYGEAAKGGAVLVTVNDSATINAIK